MKVFLSHRMSDVPINEINSIRGKAIAYLQDKYGDISVIDNYNHEDAPENAGSLWHLGRSIQQLENVDAVYFVPCECNSVGCKVERLVCKLYKLKVLQ